MGKNMDNEMDAGIILWFVGLTGLLCKFGVCLKRCLGDLRRRGDSPYKG